MNGTKGEKFQSSSVSIFGVIELYYFALKNNKTLKYFCSVVCLLNLIYKLPNLTHEKQLCCYVCGAKIVKPSNFSSIFFEFRFYEFREIQTKTLNLTDADMEKRIIFNFYSKTFFLCVRRRLCLMIHNRLQGNIILKIKTNSKVLCFWFCVTFHCHRQRTSASLMNVLT